MKILHLIHSVNPAHGGTTTAVQTLAGACQALGHPSLTVTLDAPTAEWKSSWQTPLHFAGPGHTHYGWSPRLLPALRKLSSDVDLVIVHGLWQFHASAARMLRQKDGVPYVVAPHGMLDPWALKQSLLKRILKTVNWALVTRRVLQEASAFWFTTENERDSAAPALLGISADRRVASLGVDAPPAAPSVLKSGWQERHPELANRTVLLHLGRLHPKKGCDLLIEGFAAWVNRCAIPRDSWPHLRFAGPPVSAQYLEHLQRLCARHQLELHRDVTFAGMVTGTAKWQELAAAAALVLPSFQENFGLVVGEAMACGTPALLSDKVNICDLITGAQAGLSAEASISGVCSLLERWFAMDATARSSMQKNAKELYDSRLRPQAAGESFLKAVTPYAR